MDRVALIRKVHYRMCNTLEGGKYTRGFGIKFNVKGWGPKITTTEWEERHQLFWLQLAYSDDLEDRINKGEILEYYE